MHNMLIVDMLVCTVVSNVLVLGWRWLVNCSHLSDLCLHHRLWQRRCRAVLGLGCSSHLIPIVITSQHCPRPLCPASPARSRWAEVTLGDAPLAPRFWALFYYIFSVPCTFHTWYMVTCHTVCVLNRVCLWANMWLLSFIWLKETVLLLIIRLYQKIWIEHYCHICSWEWEC